MKSKMVQSGKQINGFNQLKNIIFYHFLFIFKGVAQRKFIFDIHIHFKLFMENTL